MAGSVSFSNEVEVKVVENFSLVEQYTPNGLYYTDDDIQEFRLQTALVIRFIQAPQDSDHATTSDHQEETSTGLESYLRPTLSRKVALRRRLLHRAVLREQHRQREVGSVEPDVIANVSKAISAWARDRAQVIGRRLEAGVDSSLEL